MAKLPTTPRSKVRTALRTIFLRSRERAAALKRETYHCQECGIKQSTAKGKEVKLEVHHIHGIDWDTLIDEVFKYLLCNPAELEVLCKDCHEKKGTLGHGKQSKRT